MNSLLILIIILLYSYAFDSLNFLERRITAAMPSSRSEDWQPLLSYKNSLMHGETDQAPVTSKRAYTRRRKETENDADDDDNDDSDADK